ncbi:predicted protein [Nematostella vectensis]|uniref:G-protein coupled receptors family 1 profile domain-containing protein n=2 Tax=Nematostella vectensis TaxID=45351 RepID=A7SMM8_NEMVE|nr:predicted protein [Nematostella vectensis]|eukprot:XP_001627147.1 predicted protein [Nematostella vectensis]
MAALSNNFSLWDESSTHGAVIARVTFNKHYPSLNFVTGILIIVIAPFNIVGNTFVIAAAVRDPLRHLRHLPSTPLICSMAASDLLIGLVYSPVSAAGHFFGNNVVHNLEHAYNGLCFWLVTSSVLHILGLCVDRLMAVARPNKYSTIMTPRRAKLAAVGIWLYSVAFALMVGFLSARYALGLAFTIQIMLVILIIQVFYSFILFFVHRQAKRVQRFESSATTVRLVLERERKVTRAILTMLTVFKTCFVPWTLTQVVFYACAPCRSQFHILVLCYYVMGMLINLNAAVNPFLYAWRLRKYRNTIENLIDGCPVCMVSSPKTYQVEDVVMGQVHQSPQASNQEME